MGHLTQEIAHLYPNADFLHMKKIVTRKHLYTGEQLFIAAWNPFGTETPQFFYDNCQLILRELDDLTEKELKNIKLFFRVRDKMKPDELKDWAMAVINTRLLIRNLPHYVADYLRSICVDIDGLIDSGVAIKNNK